LHKLINIPEGASLAIHGMAVLASVSPERINVKKLAKILDASEAHLAKIFQQLAKINFVNSVRGPAGGYELKADPENLSFLDIYEVVEGKVEIGNCPIGKSDCMFAKCIFGKPLNAVAKEIYDILKGIKLSQFLKEYDSSAISLKLD